MCALNFSQESESAIQYNGKFILSSFSETQIFALFNRCITTIECPVEDWLVNSDFFGTLKVMQY